MANSRLCSIPDCGKPHLARGWCRAHYQRWKKHGDPHGGGQSPGVAFAYFRDTVLNYEGADCLTWPYSRSDKGRGTICIDSKTYNVARLCCEIAHGPPPSSLHHAAHSCGNGHEGCVSKQHLRWATASENAVDRMVHGTGRNKLSEDDVRQIRLLRGSPLQPVCDKFGIQKSQVWRIQTGRDWSWVED